MKNRRDICAATEAGFVKFEGLPGAIKTGCQLSWLSGYHHAPRVSKMEIVGDENDQNEGVIKLIISQKQTCSDIYYQVKYKECVLLA